MKRQIFVWGGEVGLKVNPAVVRGAPLQLGFLL
jgi:hypothetical protein